MLETEEENIPVPHRDISFYGCINPLPTLTISESEENLENKRMLLIEAYNNQNSESVNIVQLMEKTSPLLLSEIHGNKESTKIKII